MSAALKLEASKVPPQTRRAFNVHVNRQVYRTKEKVRTAADDAAALDAMCADPKLAPRKPPPLPSNLPQVRSAGSRNLPKQKLEAPAAHWTGEGWRF